MSCKRGQRACCLLLTAVLAAGCGKQSPEQGIARIAVVPLENLTGDPNNDWISQAAAAVLVSDLTGVKGLQPVGLRSRNDVALSGASRVVMGYYSMTGGKLRIYAAVRDTSQEKTAANYAVSGVGAVAAANSLAKSVDASARPFGTANDAALRAYSEAAPEKAVALDPNFGEAWLALIERRIQSGDAAAARQAVEQSRARGANIREIERARIDFFAANLDGNAQAASQALQNLTRLIPGDPALILAVAQTESNARRFDNAAAWFRKAAALEPKNADLWNQLLYASASAGDYSGVKQAFESYRKAAPDSANAWDSLGEASYYLGRFAESEKAFLEANRTDPAFLNGWTMLKAAHARRMQGDQAGAAGLFGKFLQSRKQSGDPLIDYYQARWDYVSGNPQDAIKLLASASRKPETAALMDAQLAAWKIASGDMAAARAITTQAMSQPATPNARLQAFLCLFISQPKAPEQEWRARAAKILPSALQEISAGYAMLFSGDFAGAAAALKTAYDAAPPSESGEIGVPLAWALAESGKREEAKALLRYYPVPPSDAGRVFDFLDLRKALELRRALGL